MTALASGTVHRLPADMRKVFVSSAKLRTLWESLTPLARNEWICWVTFPKKAETRAKHVVQMQENLLEGKRRPCCWIGCPHRADKKVSPSVQSVLARRKLR